MIQSYLRPTSIPVSSTVIILKKMQGSVWRETGRTGVCPTPEWLHSSYGQGEYELRLKAGNRVLCMVGVNTQRLGNLAAE
ncbi:MAG: hypothetical protein RJA70_3287 [Pseudomonadota bacterium]|jgi:hypothetical protein